MYPENDLNTLHSEFNPVQKSLQNPTFLPQLSMPLIFHVQL